MTDEDWNRGYVKCLGVRLAGDLIGDVDERGEPIVDDTALILLNAHHEPIPFTLPQTLGGQVWECVLDTSTNPTANHASCGGRRVRPPRSLAGRAVHARKRRRSRSRVSRAEVETAASRGPPAGASCAPAQGRPLEKPECPARRRR